MEKFTGPLRRVSLLRSTNRIMKRITDGVMKHMMPAIGTHTVRDGDHTGLIQVMKSTQALSHSFKRARVKSKKNSEKIDKETNKLSEPIESKTNKTSKLRNRLKDVNSKVIQRQGELP